MIWIQQPLRLKARSRGFHLITREVVESLPDLPSIQTGMLQVFIQHTSASLTLNENASPEVLTDLEAHFKESVKENQPYYRHTLEGTDDMPAHIKASLMGSSLMLPIEGGRLALGTWQGIILCEHRNHGGARNLLLTAWGQGA